jgi:anthraniloyl-CoA monooxygenase
VKIGILGGGPAGLYCGLLLKKANPSHDVSMIERNAPDATYGWGVVFSDRTLASFQEADYKSYHAITNHFVLWDAIDIHYQGQLIRCGGHIFAGLARKQLLALLQLRCTELGVTQRYQSEVHEPGELAGYDLVIAADGVNSLLRKEYASAFQPSLVAGKARFIWLGTTKVLDAFTFIFRENEHGLFQVHAYPFSGDTGTFIVECDEETWLRAGLDHVTEAESIYYCEQLFAEELRGARLLPNNSKWTNFITVKNASWHHQNVVLLGDAAHTAHFSIGSGTKLAMEDAIALAHTLEAHQDLETALADYEAARKPVIEVFQAAAAESRTYFESVRRYSRLPPYEFAFNLLTRSGRVSYDDLRLRDSSFGDSVDRQFQAASEPPAAVPAEETPLRLISVPPVFTPFRLRSIELPNRLVAAPLGPAEAALGEDGVPSPAYQHQLRQQALSGAGLVMIDSVVCRNGRVSPESLGAYTKRHLEVWRSVVDHIHSTRGVRIGMTLNHAGRRGAVRPAREGLDRPLRQGGWPLISASPLPFSRQSRTPCELDGEDMRTVCESFLQAAQLADQAGFDLLQVHMAHGYLLASFLSPLTNHRTDAYGGPLENRMKFPLEVFKALRAVWPESKPLAVALNVADGVRGGLGVEEGVEIAGKLKEQGCDLISILAGQTVPESEMTYGRGFLTSLSDHIRNAASIPTLVGGYLTTANQINTILAAGRGDLCLMYSSTLYG